MEIYYLSPHAKRGRLGRALRGCQIEVAMVEKEVCVVRLLLSLRSSLDACFSPTRGLIGEVRSRSGGGLTS